MDRGFGEGGTDRCVLIEVVESCEGETPGGAKVVVEIRRVFFQHPPGASSSFGCISIDGTDGAAFLIVISGPGAQPGRDRLSGTLGAGPSTGVFDIFSGGPLTFNATLTKDGKSATDMEVLDVPTDTSNPGDASCRK